MIGFITIVLLFFLVSPAAAGVGLIIWAGLIVMSKLIGIYDQRTF